MDLRVDDKPRTFDFRPGKQGWGHALHASTFRRASPRKVKRGLFKKPMMVERVSFMVHCQNPRIGDTVIYEAQSGTVRTCEIVDIDYCRNPPDMFTLTVEEKSRPPQVGEAE